MITWQKVRVIQLSSVRKSRGSLSSHFFADIWFLLRNSVRGDTLVKNLRVSFQRPPSYGKQLQAPNISASLNFPSFRHIIWLHVTAEQIGLEEHEELYGGGSPTRDHACSGFSILFHLDKAPRLSISIVIWILSSDTLFASSTNSVQIVRRQCCLVSPTNFFRQMFQFIYSHVSEKRLQN